MASSSHETSKNNENNSKGRNPISETALFRDQDGEDNWLELGLGLGFSKVRKKNEDGSKQQLVPSDSSLSYISLALPVQNSPSVKLGRCSGLGSDLSLRRVVGVVDQLHHCQDSLLRRPGHSAHYDYYNGMALWPSSSSLHMDSARYNSHHHSTTSPYDQPGLWFTLRSSTNRNGEALPQIPKAYIRVKDENVTILTVKKYLVAKLGLSNEAEIDILCTGQSLPHLRTLKQVRDTVWLPRVVESANSTSISVGDLQGTTSPYLMSLHYQRQCISN